MAALAWLDSMTERRDGETDNDAHLVALGPVALGRVLGVRDLRLHGACTRDLPVRVVCARPYAQNAPSALPSMRPHERQPSSAGHPKGPSSIQPSSATHACKCDLRTAVLYRPSPCGAPGEHIQKGPALKKGPAAIVAAAAASGARPGEPQDLLFGPPSSVCARWKSWHGDVPQSFPFAQPASR